MQQHWMRRVHRMMVAGVAAIVVVAAQAQGEPPLAIRAVTASTQGGAEMLRVEFSRPLTALPTGFAIQSPARIALDIPGAANGMAREQVELDQGNLRSARVVSAQDRARLVLNLRTAVPWKARIEDGALLVALEAPATLAPAGEDRPRGAVEPLVNLDFRRAADGAGRIVVDLPGPLPADIRQEGGKLVLDFLRASLPEGLRRRMDVADFGTPVRAITARQTGDRVRIEVEATGAWEHRAYQSDRQFVLEVRQQAPADADKPTPGREYSGEKISLNFQSVEVRALLAVIADFTQFNIVTSDSVTGAVTLRLQDVPWDQALDIILRARNLGMRKSGNVLWIAPRDEIAAKEKLELEARAAIQTLEPVRTQSFALSYAKAAEVAAQLTAGAGANRVLSARGSVLAEPRTNQLFVTDIGTRLEAVQQLIGRIDVPVRQVLIEARIVEASDTFGKSLGARLGLAGTVTTGSGGIAFGNSYDAVAAATGQTTATSTSSTSFVNLPATGQGGFSAASFALSLFNAGANRFINLELSALEADGKGRLVSSPRILTANQAKATIEQGTEFPYQQSTSSGATAVAFRKATLKLEVTPQITPDGKVILDLDISKDSRGETTAAGIAIDTKHVQTQALVDNGGTVVIGGIFELTESDSETRVPVLGELPVVGALFRTRSKTRDKQEMLIFITPRVVQEMQGMREAR